MMMGKKKAIYIRVEPEERERIQKAAKRERIKSVSKLGVNLLLNFAAKSELNNSRRKS